MESNWGNLFQDSRGCGGIGPIFGAMLIFSVLGNVGTAGYIVYTLIRGVYIYFLG